LIISPADDNASNGNGEWWRAMADDFGWLQLNQAPGVSAYAKLRTMLCPGASLRAIAAVLALCLCTAPDTIILHDELVDRLIAKGFEGDRRRDLLR